MQGSQEGEAVIAKSHQVRVGEQSFNVFPSQPETVQALWAALPPDLRLALAKTAPRVVWNWEVGSLIAASRRCNVGGQPAIIWRKGPLFEATVHQIVLGCFPTLTEAKAACDAALRAQGYVLDGDTP